MNHAGAVVISPTETAAKNQYLTGFQSNGSVHYGIDVCPGGTRAGKLKGMSGLKIAVQSLAGLNQNIHFAHINAPKGFFQAVFSSAIERHRSISFDCPWISRKPASSVVFPMQSKSMVED